MDKYLSKKEGSGLKTGSKIIYIYIYIYIYITKRLSRIGKRIKFWVYLVYGTERRIKYVWKDD